MRRNILVLSLAMLAVMATSCKKEDERTLCNEGFRGSMERGHGKTHLVSDEDLSLVWDGDQPEKILVYAQVGTGSDNTTPIYDVTEYLATSVASDGNSAVFTLSNGNCLDGGHYKAFYPAGNCNVLESDVQTGTQQVQGEWVWDVQRYSRGYHYGGWEYTANDNGNYIRIGNGYDNISNHVGEGAYGHYNYINEPVYGTSKVVSTMTLPTSQMYNGKSMRNAPMMAESDGRNLDFYNLCGGLDLYLEEDHDVYITSVQIVTDNQQISGKLPISNSVGDNDPLNRDHEYIGVADNSYLTGENDDWNTVTLNCTNMGGGQGLNINGGEHFYITLPVGDYNSFYIIVHTSDGKEAVKRMKLSEAAVAAGHTFQIKRSKFSQIELSDLPYTTPPGIVPGIFTIDSLQHQVYFTHGNLWYAPYSGSPWTNEPNAATTTPQWYIAYEQFDNFAYGDDPYGYNGTNRGFDNSSYYLDGSETYHNPYNWYGTPAEIRTTSGKRQTVPSQQQYYESFCFSIGTQDEYGKINPTGTSDSRLLGGSYTEWGSLPIYNGTSVRNQWRTLTGGPNSEWHYLLMERTAAKGEATVLEGPHFSHFGEDGARWALVRVAGVPGLLIFPDHYEWPAGVPKPYYINTIIHDSTRSGNKWVYHAINWMGSDVPNYEFVRAKFGDDTITGLDPNNPVPVSMTCEFRLLEKQGFVFLPCVCLREGTGVRYCGGLPNSSGVSNADDGWGQDLRYYSASPVTVDDPDGSKAYYIGVKTSGTDRMDLIFGVGSDNSESLTSNDRYYGRAVRLVADVR